MRPGRQRQAAAQRNLRPEITSREGAKPGKVGGRLPPSALSPVRAVEGNSPYRNDGEAPISAVQLVTYCVTRAGDTGFGIHFRSQVSAAAVPPPFPASFARLFVRRI